MSDFGRSLLALAPLLFFGAAWLLLAVSNNDSLRWRGGLVQAALASGVLLVAAAEALSLLRALRPLPVAIVWLTAALVLIALGWRTGRLQTAFAALKRSRPRLQGPDWLLIGGMGLIGLASLIIAVFSPASNIDSLLYHMARVAHWSQAASLEPYAAVYHHQLLMPPMAEMAILQVRLLAGSDLFVNVMQWAAMVVSVVLVSGIAARLGAGPRGQILASSLAISVPLGILQASSTQNDYVVTLWIVCAAYLALKSHGSPPSLQDDLALGAAAGLGVLTKATAWPYLAPFLVWYGIRRLRTRPMRAALTSLALAAGVALILNLGHWGRNLLTYGHPIGEPEYVGSNLALADWIDSSGDGQRMSAGAWIAAPLDLAGWTGARMIRSLALNLVTPVGRVNQILRQGIQRYSGEGGLFNEKTLSALENAAWNHEDTAANPLHLVVAVITFFGLIAVRRAPEARARGVYAAATACGFVLLQILVAGADAWFGIRFQLPLFILISGLGGAVLSLLLGSRATWVAAGLALVAALPWVLLNNTRPIIGMPPWPTRTESIFTASRDELMFAVVPHIREPYRALADTIQQSGCTRVGLRIDSSGLEYLFWWVLDAEKHGIELQVVEPLPSLAKYLDPGFEACAVICTTCGDRQDLGGLARQGQYGNAALFLGAVASQDSDG